MNTETLNRRFGGMDRLYGAGSLARLAAAHACVIGIGGVGSWAVEALARSGLGRLTLIDLDHVAESNLNRQAQALEDTLGMAKVQAMAARVAAINPGCAVVCIEDFVRPDTAASLIPQDAWVVDAIDQADAKAALLAVCRVRDQFVVTTGGAGGRHDPAQIRVADLARTTHDPLAAGLRQRLRRDHGFPREGDFGVPCVYSIEPMQRPVACATHDLNCGGYGSSVCVTAAFGLAAASRLLDAVLAAPDNPAL
jgi:tRNA A37 threonylcarbamoyladenosine dehydratase